MGRMSAPATSMESAIRDALATVEDPEIHRPITDLDMVESVAIDRTGAVRLGILLTVAGCPLRDKLRADITAAVAAVPGVTGVAVDFGVMTQEQRQQLLDQLAEVAMRLYQQGRLSDQQLARLCSSIMELDHDMQNRETQLQEIKSEVYPSNQFAPAPTADYTPPTGAAAPSPSTAAPPPQPSQPSGAGARGQLQVCPTCGSPVRPRALYCRNCGTKLR